MKKVLAILLSAALIATFFSGCAKTEVKNEIQNEESKVIMRTGELSMQQTSNLEAEYGEYPISYFDDFNSMVLALKTGKVDSLYLLPEVVARYIENHVENVIAVEPTDYPGTIGLCLGTLKEKTEVYNLLYDAIDKLSSNGTIKKLQDEYIDKYLRTKEEPTAADMPKFDNAKTIKIAITGDMPPIDFVTADGKPAGFNVALLSEISKLTNTNIELVQMNSGSRFTALKSDAIDAIFFAINAKFNVSWKSEQIVNNLPEEIVITKPYYTSRIYEVDSIKKLNELAVKGIISSQERTQKETQYTSGVLYSASLTEQEQNDKISEFEWGMGINVKYFDNLSQIMLALRSGQIDFISLLPKSTAEYIKARNADIVPYNSPATNNDMIKYSMATLEENKEVYNLLNDTLNEIIKDGTIKNIENKYINEFIGNKGEPQSLDMPHFDNAKTIKVAVTGDLPPFDFVSADGKPAGYNTALLSEIANRANVNIELVPMDEKAKVTALATKNIDAIFWLSGIKISDEIDTYYDCPKGVKLTNCYYEDDLYDICIKGGNADKMFSEK